MSFRIEGEIRNSTQVKAKGVHPLDWLYKKC